MEEKSFFDETGMRKSSAFSILSFLLIFGVGVGISLIISRGVLNGASMVGGNNRLRRFVPRLCLHECR